MLAALSQAHADTLRVPSQYPNIQAAVDAASPGDEILLAPGVYTGAGNRDVALPDFQLTLRGERSGAAGCVVDAERAGRALLADGADAAVVGISFRGGLAEDGDGGGAILARGATLIFRGCEFISNKVSNESECVAAGGAVSVGEESAIILEDCHFRENESQAPSCVGTGRAHGAGLHATNSQVEIIDCTFTDNRATGGIVAGGAGGGAFFVGGWAHIEDSAFQRNGASSGAGLFLEEVDATLIGVTFGQNRAVAPLDGPAQGGGLDVRRSSATIANCSFHGNEVVGDSWPVAGGGMFTAGSRLDVANTVFTDNRVSLPTCDSADDAVGGAIAVNGNSDVRLDHVTIADGDASCAGSGVYAFGAVRAPTSLTMFNSILHGNDLDQIHASESSDALTLNVEYSLIEGSWTGEGNIDGVPLFADPAGGDYALLPGSPAIDAGSVSRLPPDTLDLDGDGDTTEPLPLDIVGAPRRLDDPATPDTGEGPPPLPDMGAHEHDVGCPADCDGDGELTFFDFLCFQNQFAAGDPEADCDGDGELTFFDFLCFQSEFAAGCP